MKGSESVIISNIYKFPIVQIKNERKDVTVTFNMVNGFCFITNFLRNDIPISSYLNKNDLQRMLSKTEIVSCCKKCIEEGGWKFHFWKGL